MMKRTHQTSDQLKNPYEVATQTVNDTVGAANEYGFLEYSARLIRNLTNEISTAQGNVNQFNRFDYKHDQQKGVVRVVLLNTNNTSQAAVFDCKLDDDCNAPDTAKLVIQSIIDRIGADNVTGGGGTGSFDNQASCVKTAGNFQKDILEGNIIPVAFKNCRISELAVLDSHDLLVKENQIGGFGEEQNPKIKVIKTGKAGNPSEIVVEGVKLDSFDAEGVNSKVTLKNCSLNYSSSDDSVYNFSGIQSLNFNGSTVVQPRGGMGRAQNQNVINVTNVGEFLSQSVYEFQTERCGMNDLRSQIGGMIIDPRHLMLDPREVGNRFRSGDFSELSAADEHRYLLEARAASVSVFESTKTLVDELNLFPWTSRSQPLQPVNQQGAPGNVFINPVDVDNGRRVVPVVPQDEFSQQEFASKYRPNVTLEDLSEERRLLAEPGEIRDLSPAGKFRSFLRDLNKQELNEILGFLNELKEDGAGFWKCAFAWFNSTKRKLISDHLNPLLQNRPENRDAMIDFVTGAIAQECKDKGLDGRSHDSVELIAAHFRGAVKEYSDWINGVKKKATANSGGMGLGLNGGSLTENAIAAATSSWSISNFPPSTLNGVEGFKESLSKLTNNEINLLFQFLDRKPPEVIFDEGKKKSNGDSLAERIIVLGGFNNGDLQRTKTKLFPSHDEYSLTTGKRRELKLYSEALSQDYARRRGNENKLVSGNIAVQLEKLIVGGLID